MRRPNERVDKLIDELRHALTEQAGESVDWVEIHWCTHSIRTEHHTNPYAHT